MSMRDYGVDDYGLLFQPEVMKSLAAKLVDDYSDEEYFKDMYGFHDEVQDVLGLTYISGFDGEARAVEDDGTGSYFPSEADYFDNDTVYYLPLCKYPGLFVKAYKNMDEIIDELKSRVGEYLPDDFDYRSNIRHFMGTYFG